jgi:hypothetical protein
MADDATPTTVVETDVTETKKVDFKIQEGLEAALASFGETFARLVRKRLDEMQETATETQKAVKAGSTKVEELNQKLDQQRREFADMVERALQKHTDNTDRLVGDIVARVDRFRTDFTDAHSKFEQSNRDALAEILRRVEAIEVAVPLDPDRLREAAIQGMMKGWEDGE